MLCVARSFLVIFLYLNLPVLVFSQAAPASMSPEVLYGESWVEWPASRPDSGLLLTIAGPEGVYLKQEHPAGSWARFNLIDNRGQTRADGFYKWELVVQAAWETPGQGQVQSGWFELRGGTVVAEGKGENSPVVVEAKAPGNSLYVDQEGRVGIGTSVPQAQLHLKGPAPALAIEDTRAGGREYRLLGKGTGSLGLFDHLTGKARWLVDSEGRMGINTTNPTSTLTVDGYIETTKGFLINGRPVGGIGVGLPGGAQPLSSEGTFNSLFGQDAGAWNTGLYTSFFGTRSGSVNGGHNNSFFGYAAGEMNSTGGDNSFFGCNAGGGNTTGAANSFFGFVAGYLNTTGQFNSFLGHQAGGRNTVESFNTFVGAGADLTGLPSVVPITNATAIGFLSSVSSSNSLVLGGVKGFNGAVEETFVGIGTPSPDRQLVVEGSQALGKFRRYNETTPGHAPAFLFERARGTNTAPLDIQPGDYLGKVQFRGRVAGNMPEYGALAFIAADAGQNGRFSFIDRDLATERMVIYNTGQVGIGTNAPLTLLDVAGDTLVRGQLYVTVPPIQLPDYVFEPDYDLMPLPDLERYIKTEKHLPNIPSAREMREMRLNLGEQQIKLLEKIEELTLYTVEQAKQIQEDRRTIRQQQKTIQDQQEGFDSLKAEVEELKRLSRSLRQVHAAQ